MKKNMSAVLMAVLMLVVIFGTCVTGLSTTDVDKNKVEVRTSAEKTCFKIAKVSGYMQRTNWVDYLVLGCENFDLGLQTSNHPFNSKGGGCITGEIRCSGFTEGSMIPKVVTVSSGEWRSSDYILFSPREGYVTGFFFGFEIIN